MAKDAKRKMLTPAERVAKLEADLAEAKAKAEAKDRKAHDLLGERKLKLEGQIEKLEAQLAGIEAEMQAIEERHDIDADVAPTLAVVEAEAEAV